MAVSQRFQGTSAGRPAKFLNSSAEIAIGHYAMLALCCHSPLGRVQFKPGQIYNCDIEAAVDEIVECLIRVVDSSVAHLLPLSA